MTELHLNIFQILGLLVSTVTDGLSGKQTEMKIDKKDASYRAPEVNTFGERAGSSHENR